MSHGHAYEVYIVISMGKSAKNLILSLLLTGRSYWPKNNASELHFARSLQGHPIWPYFERPNMHILTSFLLINSSTKRLIQMEWSPRDGGCRKQVCLQPSPGALVAVTVWGGMTHPYHPSHCRMLLSHTPSVSLNEMLGHCNNIAENISR